jgi:hypothetical protein
MEKAIQEIDLASSVATTATIASPPQDGDGKQFSLGLLVDGMHAGCRSEMQHAIEAVRSAFAVQIDSVRLSVAELKENCKEHTCNQPKLDRKKMQQQRTITDGRQPTDHAGKKYRSR